MQRLTDLHMVAGAWEVFVVSYLAANGWAEDFHLASPSTFPLQNTSQKTPPHISLSL